MRESERPGLEGMLLPGVWGQRGTRRHSLPVTCLSLSRLGHPTHNLSQAQPHLAQGDACPTRGCPGLGDARLHLQRARARPQGQGCWSVCAGLSGSRSATAGRSVPREEPSPGRSCPERRSPGALRAGEKLHPRGLPGASQSAESRGQVPASPGVAGTCHQGGPQGLEALGCGPRQRALSGQSGGAERSGGRMETSSPGRSWRWARGLGPAHTAVSRSL